MVEVSGRNAVPTFREEFACANFLLSHPDHRVFVRSSVLLFVDKVKCSSDFVSRLF